MTKAKKRAPKKAVVLPYKMSALIGIALRDIRKAERAKQIIDMSDWYDPKTEVSCTTDGGVEVDTYTVCTMCAAGSVMAYSLATERQKKHSLSPGDFSKNESQLYAIDSLRKGAVGSAALNLNLPEKTDLGFYNRLNLDIPEYNNKDPEPFHIAMKKLQVKLEKLDL